MRIAITGATGTLGTALVRALLNRGDRVAILSRTPTILRKLSGLPVEVYTYTPAGMDSALAAGSLDAVIHAACSYGRSQASPCDLIEANVLTPLHIAIRAGTRIGHWINIGTGLPRTVSPYAVSKGQFADWLQHLSPQQLAPRTTIALEHFYGPGDDPSKFLTRVARACVRSEPLDLTIGAQRRDFIHLQDAVNGIITALDHPTLGHRILPLGSGEAVPVRTVVEQIHAAANSLSKLCFGAIPTRPNEPDICIADPSLLRSLGWSPTITLAAGINALVASEQEIYTP